MIATILYYIVVVYICVAIILVTHKDGPPAGDGSPPCSNSSLGWHSPLKVLYLSHCVLELIGQGLGLLRSLSI